MEQIIRNSTDIIIGIPSKGHLKSPTIEFLSKFGLEITLKTKRLFRTEITEHPNYKIVLSHPMDIPFLLDQGVIDIGFTGLDIIREKQIKLRPIVKTGYGKVKMCLMTTKIKNFNHPLYLQDKSIATPFPNIAQDYFDKLKIKIKLYPIHGTSEIMPYLGFVDGIIDIVETGASAHENNLNIIADDIFISECVAAVSKPELHSNYFEVNNFLRRIYQ